METFKVTIEYDGARYSGWQAQQNARTITGELQKALKQMYGFPVEIQGAGRTDAGVHALGQVAHFDLEKTFEAGKVRDALNYYLKPSPVVVLDAQGVDSEFHARFSATARHYLFRILNRRSPPALEHGRVWHVPHPLDSDAMQAAARYLVGQHDFTTFRAAECQAKSPVKTM